MKLTQFSMASLALLAVPFASWGQTAVVSGYLGAFDVLNDTGQNAHGFEIQLEGALPSDLYYIVPGGRYGAPTIVPYATGVYVRYQSAYDAATGTYAATTPQATLGAAGFSWQDCYQGGFGYPTSGCEHLGQSMRTSPAGLAITGRWLVDDPNNPGQLIRVDPPAAIPFYAWSILPPPTTPTAPVVVTKVVAPRPATAQFGEAFWIKVFKTDLSRSVSGDELSSTNPSVVPEDPTQVETPWSLLQSIPAGVNGKHGNKANQAAIAIATGSVVRRYEMYKYTGAYDPLTHEALCLDTVCNTPGTGELGAAVSAQNTASNVVADSLSVNKSGSGASGTTVSGSNISCGSSCAVFATNGAAFTLTASPGSAVFGGWSGACSGTQLSCSGTINGRITVGASFLLQFTLSVGRSNPGTVTATPAGNDRTLNCGGNCSAKFTDGTVVTLTATPPAGKLFVNWSGACSGTSPTCSVTIAKDTSVQAVFSK
jgi:hypothetical protein